MPTIVVALKDIITDAANPVDLTTLPEHEAERKIRDIYGFVGDLVDVTIDGGIATITLPEEDERKGAQALQKLAQASRIAKRGQYRQAISLYQEVLRVLPGHSEARRELGMAYMEIGNAHAAKEQLISAIQLNPKDAWAHLILGNLYYQMENDLGSAERYYALATDLAPGDAYVLNSYASLLGKRNKFDAAIPLFEQAIDADPEFPNPRYGLALVQSRQGHVDTALATLETVPARPMSADPRHQPVYAEARQLYTDLRRLRATDHADETTQRLREVIADYAAQTGFDIRLQQEPSLPIDAKVELAWRYNRPYHLIKYGRRGINPYVVAHEFEHIQLETEARSVQRSRLFAVGPEQAAVAERAVEKDLRKLRSRKGLNPQSTEQYIQSILQGLPNQLYNIPLDLFINRRVHDAFPRLHDDQFVWLADEHAQNSRAVTDPDIRNTAPARIYQASMAMNAAYALFVDDLFGQVTNYAAAYQPTGMLATGRRLYELYQAAGAAPGAENDLVDAWAKELRLADWYTWRPDDTAPPEDTAGRSAEIVGQRHPDMGRVVRKDGASQPGYFDDPAVQVTAAMYMVGALKRFARMDPQAIFQIASEIALLGDSGIEYGSSEQRYTLRALPGERFSGLELLCLEYVGFKLARPELDLGIPLDGAYHSALQMYEAGK